ncbi:uncharacterized protein LOC6568750 [Drosophila grimshawi]|uniref:GH23111 n=1 Tax=Drosophila grimshawi TaxID=7222 RepID=B4JVF3_DROGR|nr:uncharacterized protein LOC6568750 [Drosophila grimshawi]EDV98421.1 GH23111 [Drosophila grimshawi]
MASSEETAASQHEKSNSEMRTKTATATAADKDKETDTDNDKDKNNDKDRNKELSTKEAYFASLTEWAKQAALIQMFPNYLLANYNYPQLSGFPPTSLPATAPAAAHSPMNTEQVQPNRGQAINVPPANVPSFSRFRVLDEVQQQEIIRRVGGTEMIVAPFWKRFVAEAIDMFILFVLKIIATFALFHLFNLDFNDLFDENVFVSFMDLTTYFFSMSSDLLLIELLTKLMVCCYECLWTTFFDGATPGKSIMKIRILYVEAVLPLQAPIMPQFAFQAQREPVRALLYPAEVPSLLRSLMRAFAKNLVMTLLFPICVLMIFFKNNRTAYDIFTKTIVVEANPSPHPAQRPHQQ